MMLYDRVEWRTDSYRGWAISYPIVTDSATGARYTPLDAETWRVLYHD